MRCVLSKNLAALAIFVSTIPVSAIAVSALAAQDTRILAEKPLDSAHAVQLRETSGQIHLVVVSNATRQEALMLDSYPAKSIAAWPVLEVFGAHSAYLHFYGDYGLYYGSRKYLFDLGTTQPPVKIPYGIMSLRSTSRQGEKLVYSGSFAEGGEVQDPARQRSAVISIDPRASGFPAYEVSAVGPPLELPLPIEPVLRGPAGERVVVEHTTPPGEPHRPSTILVGSRGNEEAFPAPIPTLDLYRRILHRKQPPDEIESDIGPYAQDIDKIWFATTFYDGEGVSGVGAIGSFDISARKYEMRYLPAIAPWSGSAILLDGGDLWIGLKRRPEGADIAGGLLKYNVQTGAVETFAIPDVIFTIDRAQDAIYCGTSHGLYTIRGARVTQFRFEPVETGRLVMIPRDVPQRPDAAGSVR
ncbi:MAG TPA: hypothetical protein VKX49_12375 [Bryobacteraceae bacterium]|nr:hypothetical protein [Bryobacteraceae bacterium]